MSLRHFNTESEPELKPRIESRNLGRHAGAHPGPTVIVVGGLHGNEPAGVLAAQRVLAQLRRTDAPYRGELVGLVGNLQAVRRGERQIARDLNRIWSAQRIAALQGDCGRSALANEDLEQLELLEALEEITTRADGPVYLLDLHTSSSFSSPFAIITDDPASRELAARLPIPSIAGLDHHIGDVLTSYVGSCGVTAVALEAGRHDDPVSVSFLEAAVWVALAAIGSIDRSWEGIVAGHVDFLAGQVRRLPETLQVFHRHPVTPDDGFRMQPGYRSFCRVEAGETVAFDSRGAVQIPESGWMLLPLYQPTGEDGFFLAREARVGKGPA